MVNKLVLNHTFDKSEVFSTQVLLNCPCLFALIKYMETFHPDNSLVALVYWKVNIQVKSIFYSQLSCLLSEFTVLEVLFLLSKEARSCHPVPRRASKHKKLNFFPLCHRNHTIPKPTKLTTKMNYLPLPVSPSIQFHDSLCAHWNAFFVNTTKAV